MTHRSQGQQDADWYDSDWNVRTLHRSSHIAKEAREMTRRGINIMGIGERHWMGQGTIQLAEGETIIYSGRDDDNHREGVGILMSKHAAGSLMDWTPSRRMGYSSQNLFQIN